MLYSQRETQHVLCNLTVDEHSSKKVKKARHIGFHGLKDPGVECSEPVFCGS